MAARVLYVEDAPAQRELVQDVLTEHGWRVDAVATAEEALERLLSDRFDLLLTDYKLPGRNADWLLRELRARGLMQDAQVVLLSAEERPPGVSGIWRLRKPVELGRLLGTLRAIAPPEEDLHSDVAS